MKCKALSVVIFCLVCIPLFTGCSLLPLREEKPRSVNIAEQEEESETTSEKEVIAPSAVEEEKDIMICTSPVNVRDAASSNSRVIGSLKTGEEVAVLSKDGGWIEIEYDGESAYVYEDYLEEPKSSTGNRGGELDVDETPAEDESDTDDSIGDTIQGTDVTKKDEKDQSNMYLDE